MTDDVSFKFKAAMRRLATTVSLVTSGKPGAWSGMAATAVVSICAEPPTLLVSVNRSASIHPTLLAEDLFCVNLLSSIHRDLVHTFSGRVVGSARFEHGAWSEGIEGLPILDNALSSLTCRIETRQDIGTHTIFVGEVIHIANHLSIDPLIWVNGGFASMVPDNLSLGAG